MADANITWKVSDPATKAPSGLTITREGNKFTFTWKIPSCKYEKGQQLQWRRKISGKWEAWKVISIGTSVTTKQVTVSAASFYPTSGKTDELNQVEFRVRGKRKGTDKATYDWSEWSEKKYDVAKPETPAVSAALSTTLSNVCTFSWSVSVDTKSKKWFTDLEWQTILVKDCSETNGSKLKWNSSASGWNAGTGSATGSHTITENTATLANGSYTRWFRVRSRGPEGNTEWKYTKHVYAAPNKTNVKDVSVTEDPSGGIQITTVWEASNPATNPIDKTTVQYKIAVPDTGLACPSGGSWSDVNVSKDTSGKDAASFVIDNNLQADQCLWTRVNTQHDTNVTYGTPTLTKIGKLKDPTNVSVSTNDTTHKATITATNASTVSDSFLVIIFRRSMAPDDDLVVGIIPHNSSSVTVQCPDWGDDPAVAFGVYACVGSYAAKTRADGADSYAVTARMQSANTVWEGGAVPVAPGSVTVAATETEGTVRVTWNWAWSGADAAELSWSDHRDAWESTDEPSTFLVSNLYASAWNISGLETGKKWYVRVRLIKEETYGPYSDIKEIDLSSAPSKPVLVLSQALVQKTGSFTAYWDYTSTDATQQEYAEIRQATVSSGQITLGDSIAHELTAQNLDIPCPAGWTAGQTYLLCLQVTSSSGRKSEWSDLVAITVADPVTAAITQHSLEEVTIDADVAEEETRTVLALTEMPLTVTATGAGTGGETTIIIERAADYQVDRPDETEFNGYEGETIVLYTQSGESQITITNENLIGKLDDGAAYRLWAVVEDSLGQTDAAMLEFEVHWEHQAVMPKAEATLRGSAIEITPVAPTGAQTGDVCDIYRLSADKPVLIAENVEFDETYVDPYPAIGDLGGHRVVFKTANGDYITEDNEIAWIDLADEFDEECSIIDFGGDQAVLRYDLSFSNQWAKEFTETKYLGGSVQGDWGPGVSRNAAISGTLVTVNDDDTIAALRRLATYTGICHVRTQDGSSFDADVQVSEKRSFQSGGRKVEFDMSITRVDPVGMAALPVGIWEA